jgi:hypothetical protein
LRPAASIVGHGTIVGETPRTSVPPRADSAHPRQVHLHQASELGSERFTGKQENLDARPAVCLKLARALVDLQVAAEDGPSPLANLRQSVLILRAQGGFA